MMCFYSRRKQDEVQVLEQTIRQRSEQQKKAGIELDATCHICLKTKFADGVGHMCNYCHIRCCARCGGKVTLRSNKVYHLILLFFFRIRMIQWTFPLVLYKIVFSIIVNGFTFTETHIYFDVMGPMAICTALVTKFSELCKPINTNR